ncbi:glycoside hydrolase family 3 N-terminal domain-containing protein [Ignavibacteria bacterium 4148-Me]|uniref:glycoside hydrolase family 3 protein n=1 Tax=Rosettibacter primus TaxID=3111523 RepID=UPI00336BAEE5
MRKRILYFVVILLALISCRNSSINSFNQDELEEINKKVDALLSKMTLDEKIGQMIQVDRSAVINNPQDIKNYFIGSILSGGGSAPETNTPEAWANMYDMFQSYALQTRLKIPIIYGIDAVHGHNNVYGAVIFPHNIGLGCTRNPDIVEQVARATAIEVAATGIDWTFAPCIAVPQDERWGRTYEGFGETSELAEMMAAAAVRGYQTEILGSSNSSILACAKHFLGDGGTKDGKDQGDTQVDESVLRRVHLPGYISAINAGVGSVMVSYSSIFGQKMHGNKYWITDVLKGELKFQGFVVSDWGGVDQLPGDYKTKLETAINAGIDMVMLPYDYKNFFVNMKQLINENRISISRIDDAVRRILRVKFQLGLFEKPFADRSLLSKVGSQEHRTIAREAVRQSLVLLKNNKILPLSKSNKKILVAGKAANDIGIQCGGWTIAWQGAEGNVTKGTTILEAIKKAVSQNSSVTYSIDGNNLSDADVAIAVIGEKPYAEGQGDRTDLNLSKEDLELISKIRAKGIPLIVILISGRPMIITNIIEDCDAFIAAWLPGTEGDGIADVIFGDYKPTGKLSHSWPRSMSQIPINIGDNNYNPLFPYGYGLTY